MQPIRWTRRYALVVGAAVVAPFVLPGCSALGRGPAAAPAAGAPAPVSANLACAQQEMAMTAAGIEAARPVPPDSLGAIGAAQSRYAIAIAEYHNCLATH